VAGNFPKGSPLRPLWLEIKGRAFPGSTSNHHLGTLLGLLLATYEMNEFKEAFQNQVRANARAFARALPTATRKPTRSSSGSRRLVPAWRSRGASKRTTS
jgi:glycine/serine hydroxymethyltransferase